MRAQPVIKLSQNEIEAIAQRISGLDDKSWELSDRKTFWIATANIRLFAPTRNHNETFH